MKLKYILTTLLVEYSLSEYVWHSYW